MKLQEYPFQAFSSLARRSGFIIAATMVLLGLSMPISAQKCPSYIAPDLPLTIHERPRSTALHRRDGRFARFGVPTQ